MGNAARKLTTVTPGAPISEKDLLAPRQRAEDILLGALGFDSAARILMIEGVGEGFSGTGVWPDGEQFSFKSEDELSALEQWALGILLA